MSLLNAEQLTGRVRSHVLEIPQLGAILHPDAARAFLGLAAEAAESDIDLVPASSFRSFEHQLLIWNDKFHGRRPLLDQQGGAFDRSVMTEEALVRAILLWSALPGASRHHWGTEIDVIDRAALTDGRKAQLVPAEYAADGVFAKLDRWLTQHAESYGFFRPYDRDRGGVQPEPWHLSFAPVATAALQALTIDVLSEALREVELQGAEAVWPQLAEIHARYVRAVATPGARALAFNPGSRLS
jgi:LAS superfamily LD-carboxypeptidase LdcB